MAVKIDPKIFAVISAAVGTVAVAGVVAYNKSSKFKKWVDIEFYPTIKKLLKKTDLLLLEQELKLP